MDIKNVLNAILPIQTIKKDQIEKSIKSDSTTDRDANGQYLQKGDDSSQEPLSDEEFNKALDHLKTLPVVKEQSLRVDWENQEGKRIIFIKEISGKILRRITEQELKTLKAVKQNEKGQLLRRTA